MSQVQKRNQAVHLAGVSRTTDWRYVKAFRAGGVAKLCEFDRVGPVSAFAAQAKSLEAEFLARPPHTVPAAAAVDATARNKRIAQLAAVGTPLQVDGMNPGPEIGR